MRLPCLPRRRTPSREGAAEGVAQGWREDRPREPRRESFLRGAAASLRRESLFRRVLAELVEARVRLAEDPLDLVDRHVGEAAAVAQVFHMAPLVLVEGMEDRVGRAVELERLDAKAAAESEVERRRALHPFAADAELGEAVEHEQVAAHRFGEARAGEVVLHVGEADAGLDACCPAAGGEQRRLADAEAFTGLEHGRRRVHRRLGEVEERVVADAVAHRVVKRDCAVLVVRALHALFGERADGRVSAVHETTGREELAHWSSFISLRAPRNSALFFLAGTATTEKWFLPGMAMSSANAERQRSPSSAFCRRNSLDSSPPTQVITGMRVAVGRNAGERRSASAGSSRRSDWRNSTSSSGRRS